MNHTDYLLRCITLASTRLGFCAPNPAVGCVVVKDNVIISEGFHFGCGYPHAEVDALEKLGDEAKGSTLYVSLEPCCHYGRTPPCTDRIIQSGVAKVYFGLRDPNPIVAGKGQKKLREAGIACEHISSAAINDFYLSYIYWTKTRLPYVFLKLAVSRDHKIALENGKPTRITGEKCGELTHYYRNISDAILTSINTIINDNPKMNVRYDGEDIAKNIYIIDKKASLPLNATIFQTAKSITLFHADDADSDRITKLKNNAVKCIAIAKKEIGLDLHAIMQKIGEEGVHQLWIEVGGVLSDALIKNHCVNEMLLYIAPKKLGENALSSSLEIASLKSYFNHVEEKKYGEDIVFFMKN